MPSANEIANLIFRAYQNLEVDFFAPTSLKEALQAQLTQIAFDDLDWKLEQIYQLYKISIDYQQKSQRYGVYGNQYLKDFL